MIRFVKKAMRSFGFDLVKMQGNRLCNRDLFEHDVRVFIPENNPVIFDVGANKGQSIRFFKEIFKAATIYSFEPNSALYTSLLSLYGNRSDIRLYPYALGEGSGVMDLIVYANNELSSLKRIERNTVNPFSDEPIKQEEKIAIESIDDFVATNGIKKIDLLKIDTQGYELEVLKGAANSLKSGMIRNLYIELNFISIYENQSDYVEIIELLRSQHYILAGLYELNRPEHYLRWANAFFKKINE